MLVSKVGKRRYKKYQISELEKAFHINPKASLSNLQPLARRLDIKIHVAKAWFYKWQLQCAMEMDGSELSKHDID